MKKPEQQDENVAAIQREPKGANAPGHVPVVQNRHDDRALFAPGNHRAIVAARRRRPKWPRHSTINHQPSTINP